MPTGETTDAMALKHFQTLYFYFKKKCTLLKDFQIKIKLMEWCAIIWVDKDHSQLLALPTGQTTDAMVLKRFSDTIFLLKVHGFDEFLNRNQIDGMVSYYLSRCNL